MDKEKLKEAFKNLKEALFASEQKFKEAKLNDGVTVIRYDGDMPAVGMAVMAITEQGELPLPDGDYVLEDGTAMTVAGGVITACTPPEAAQGGDQGAPPATSTPQAAAQMTEGQAKTIIESIVKESRFAEDIAELKESVAALKKERETFSTQKEEDKKTIESLQEELKKSKDLMVKAIELFEKIGEEDSAAPAEGAHSKKFNVKEFKSEFKKDLQTLNQK